jgi:hypothetical protein
MAEAILGLLAAVAGLVCLIVCLIALGGIAIGGATAPDQVDDRPVFLSAIAAFVLFVAAGWLLF